jgi:glycosyltransferase involved in cell wall biosynthesis
MKFSLVTISFNQRQYLQEAMASVLDQDHCDLEYIVVDPGSTDGSRDLIRDYAGRLSDMIFETDNGAAEGLNKGFARATGDIFGFLNSDDVLLPGAMKSVARVFEQHPDCDIVMGNGFTINALGERIRRIRAGGFTLERYFYGGATWLQQATFFRRAAYYAAGGFNVDNRSCWDGELLVQRLNI